MGLHGQPQARGRVGNVAPGPREADIGKRNDGECQDGCQRPVDNVEHALGTEGAAKMAPFGHPKYGEGNGRCAAANATGLSDAVSAIIIAGRRNAYYVNVKTENTDTRYACARQILLHSGWIPTGQHDLHMTCHIIS